MNTLTYELALEALSSAARFGIHPSLDGITMLCEELGRPQDTLTAIQITGTNGKTSTARFTASLLGACEVRAGLYTSPELERVNERVEIEGRVVTDAVFAAAVSASVHAASSLRERHPDIELTEFELTTAAALWAFREHGVQIAVLEVGMGGRWDATSVVTPRVAVVTGVGLDHTEILGESLVQIAAEKAAIIRPGSTAVLAELPDDVRAVFEDVARTNGADVISPSVRIASRPGSIDSTCVLDVETPRGSYTDLAVRAPSYQAANLALAIAAVEIVLEGRLDRSALDRALASTSTPGRFELVRSAPPVIVDGSHNPQAATVLADAIEDAWPDGAVRPTVLLGVLADKDVDGIIEALHRVTGRFVVTEPDSPRALAVEELAAAVRRRTGIAPEVFGDVASAVEELSRSEAHGLVITGSLTTAGEARRAMRGSAAIQPTDEQSRIDGSGT